ncbi:PTS sugar transporter subunit IIA [[Mycoplasma] collis]|uniref:PTS sugar transporter subunit IIA n=1 Tax=[Mycoplasma] collis TaxID=2127 RepID=UPI00051C6BD6|nr:PTS sugar transporter subunit IIA [[Mycoplasma] collis]
MNLTENKIFIDIDLENKNEIMNFVFNHFYKLNSVNDKFLNSIIKRDQEVSVAIGNYVFLPHANFDGKETVLKNDIVFISLKKIIKVDNQDIKFIIALAIKDEKHLEILQNIAIAFSDIEKVESLIKKNITKKDIIDFLN